ncbi:AAA family ATPase [Arthrobacter sp. GMC3]|uniref:AAA family ATPase n=1 Tax=Arthrobacter sp. GMC3 TaxID=2058894 RepID=UPI0015E4244D|nr:AAA family ATPase [Arthrobacter sp. GMC3]
MSILIVLRGNSGSGKSAVARALQQELDAAWIEQDYFRRVVLGETGNYSPLSIELIEHAASLTLSRGRTVILDGMFNASTYSEPLVRLRDGHPGPSLFYAYDLTLEETLLRHQSRPHKAADFGEKEMRGWYRGWNPLLGIAEVRILATESLQATVLRVLADVGLP